MVFYETNPFGEDASFYRTGIVCSTFCNIYKGKDSTLCRPEDFIPKFGKKKKVRQSTEDMKAIFLGLVNISKGKKT